ncbi:SDR family oxidoreductase [Vibrio sp.]|uniref:SDR family oxidoreductase n=1 Tax=Vibrio sp. TaxID=678 RepID=UPI00311E429C
MKKTLITCATSHIGFELSKRLAPKHELILTGRNEGKLSDLEKASDNIQCHTMDFFDSESIYNVANKLEQLDNIVFIIPRIPPSNEVFPSDEEWRQLYDHYFIKPLSLLKYIIENQVLSAHGKIVFLSGLSTKSALSNHSASNCIRNAWLGQAKTMALSLGNKGISVNTLSIGGALTETYVNKMKSKAESNNLPYEQLMENEVENIPLGKYASVEDIVDSLEALLGNLTNHMTGQNILLDGGFFKGY